ncbi:MAG: CaiB/BaiF CoA transferase family protein [Sphingorhabdus sp.]
MRPLEGLLVIAVEQAVAAPFCTQRLADAGARVIKVERPGGETARHYDTAVHGVSAYFATLNQGKESIVLDLTVNEDRDVFSALLQHADILVQNLAPGALARLGFGYDELQRRNPCLIAMEIVGYGQDTDYRSMKAYDMLVQAEAGICAITGTADSPVKVGASIADIGTGMNAYAAILEAVIERQKSGRGQLLSIAMFDTIAEWCAVPIAHQVYADNTLPRRGFAHNLIAPYGLFCCLDGDLVIAVQTAAEWVKLCNAVLDKPELETDPRFATNVQRIANVEALDGEIAPHLAKMTCSEVVERLETAGIAYARYRTLPEMADHPALHRRRAEHAGTDYWIVASPIRPDAQKASPPKLNEHGDAIRRSIGLQS